MQLDEKWFVVICDNNFIIRDTIVLRNINLELDPNSLLANAILAEDIEKFLDFTMLLKKEKTIFGFEINVIDESGITTVMHFGGFEYDGRYVITAFSNYIGLYEDLIAIDNEQAKLLREKMKTLYTPVLNFNHLSELNNEIINMQRELARKNNELIILDKAMATSLNAILLTDINGVITYVNQSFIQMLGYESEQDVLGRFAADFTADAKQLASAAETLLSKGSWHGELMFKRSNNSSICCLITANTIYLKNDTPECIMASFLDITDRKEMELSLIKSKMDADAANMAKSNFLAHMSHEIRTPMNGILGFLDLLDITPLNKDQKEYINYIRTSTDTLLSVINDILDVSKIEAGMLELENIPFDLHSTIENSVISFSARALQKGLTLNMHIKCDVPRFVSGDPTKLRQIINNLIGNAIKFTPEGYIVLQAETKVKNGTDYVIQISVEDSGIGMTKEALQKIFNPFSQADESTNRKFGGTGLGLNICKSIIKIMGGTIVVDSKEGKGSKFTFTIPLKEETNNTVPIDYSSLAGSRVMIIDNNSINRSIIKSYLAEAGCIIDEIDNTTEAISKLVSDKTGIYDAILIDSLISTMKSYDISTVIKSIPSMKHTPLILMVSVDYNKDIISKEYSGYITKPYRRSEILDCLTMVINENCNISDNDSDFFTRNIKIEASRNQFETLVVDDNETNRLYFTYLLQMNGINCDIATNGEEALAACHCKNYDLIFMDCQMPIMDGYEATRKIREAEASNQHAMIIAMTAYAMKEDEVKCLASGMDDYLPKPINHDRVVALIRNIREKINARSN